MNPKNTVWKLRSFNSIHFFSDKLHYNPWLCSITHHGFQTAGSSRNSNRTDFLLYFQDSILLNLSSREPWKITRLERSTIPYDSSRTPPCMKLLLVLREVLQTSIQSRGAEKQLRQTKKATKSRTGQRFRAVSVSTEVLGKIFMVLTSRSAVLRSSCWLSEAHMPS